MRKATVSGDRFDAAGRVVEEITYHFSVYDGEENVLYLHVEGKNKSQHFTMPASEFRRVAERLLS